MMMSQLIKQQHSTAAQIPCNASNRKSVHRISGNRSLAGRAPVIRIRLCCCAVMDYPHARSISNTTDEKMIYYRLNTHAVTSIRMFENEVTVLIRSS